MTNFQDQLEHYRKTRRRRALEPPVNATPPIALEQRAQMGKTDPWSERMPDGRTVSEAVMETLRGINRQPSGVTNASLSEARSPYDDYTPGQGAQLETLELRPGQLTGRQRGASALPGTLSAKVNSSFENWKK